ncbi:MAG: NAD(P)H-dependent oxidoreductase [Solirubrobacteraceae bacterium]|nr:NAD(P)H-dependent oxidoreductase [Solirubrobacteraceae bacterium]
MPLAPDAPTHKTLVLLGQPNAQSLCGALADAYAAGAREAGSDVEVLRLGDLDFDPILHHGYEQIQQLEPDLLRAQELLRSADQLCLVTPIWWGTYPALLKGFFDRTLLPGFAFQYDKPGRQKRLLKGRQARMIITGDSPWLWLKFVVGDSTVAALRNSTLRFCGYRPVRVTRYSPVRGSTAERRAKWIASAHELGRSDHAG